MSSSNESTIIPSLAFIATIVFSNILSVILSVLWCKTLKSKLLTILLMPTNYTLIIFVFLIITFVWKFIKAIGNIPENLG